MTENSGERHDKPVFPEMWSSRRGYYLPTADEVTEKIKATFQRGGSKGSDARKQARSLLRRFLDGSLSAEELFKYY
ncbi:MAG: hypothetical protein V4449_02630 [Patescibacteria group bacterium]